MIRIAFCAVTLLTVLATGSTARGQWFDPCCCTMPAACPPVQACAPIVQQQCYQTIPVTEFQEVKQTVQRPVIETAYVDQPCTEYRQVAETKTCEIPTVQYQTVTEYQTVQRDMGHWVTQYQCNPRVAPCQYDSRPNLFGFLNRAGYSMRMAFTPPMTATRSWCPNVVTQQIPHSRQVAIRGTQQVSYQVTKMVPYTTTRKVAVNTVRMVAQEIVTKRPVTVYRTVPMGTATAFGSPIFGTGTVLNSPINSSSSATASLQPTPVEPTPTGTRTATVNPREDIKKPSSKSSRNDLPDALKEDEPVPNPKDKPSSMAPRPAKPEIALADPGEAEAIEVETRKVVGPVEPAKTESFASRPSITQVGRWVARRSAASAKKPATLTVVENQR